MNELEKLEEELNIEEKKVCPNCGQSFENENTCPNCGAIMPDDEFENFDEDDNF